MLDQIWSSLLDYLKRTPYWSRIEPWTLAAFLYVGVVVCSYQYVQWRYGITLSLPLFLHSYLLKQISVTFSAVLASYIVLTYRLLRAESSNSKAPAARRPRHLAARLTAVVLIIATALFLLQRLAPHARVSSIRVMFAHDALAPDDREPTAHDKSGPEPRTDALIYMIFVLNRLQRAWHFEIDFRHLAWDRIPAAAETECRQNVMPSLCFAKAYFQQERARDPAFPPLVVISTDQLGRANDQYWFWLHENAASVITTHDWKDVAAPTLYEYLAYTLVLQGVLTHLDIHCGGVPARPAKEGIIYGNVFEYYPQREAFKAAVLSGHLGPDDERLLLNCFGPEYLDTTSRLLKLDWLRTDPVRSDLRTVYGVEAVGQTETAPAPKERLPEDSSPR